MGLTAYVSVQSGEPLVDQLFELASIRVWSRSRERRAQGSPGPAGASLRRPGGEPKRSEERRCSSSGVEWGQADSARLLPPLGGRAGRRRDRRASAPGACGFSGDGAGALWRGSICRAAGAPVRATSRCHEAGAGLAGAARPGDSRGLPHPRRSAYRNRGLPPPGQRCRASRAARPATAEAGALAFEAAQPRDQVLVRAPGRRRARARTARPAMALLFLAHGRRIGTGHSRTAAGATGLCDHAGAALDEDALVDVGSSRSPAMSLAARRRFSSSACRTSARTFSTSIARCGGWKSSSSGCAPGSASMKSCPVGTMISSVSRRGEVSRWIGKSRSAARCSSVASSWWSAHSMYSRSPASCTFRRDRDLGLRCSPPRTPAS